jgi:hypothetical protein
VAPTPVNVAVCPAQMVGELTVTTGKGFTVMVFTAVLVHPLTLVPVTVYVVVTVGEIKIDEPMAPVFQVYVLAPLAVKVVVLPKQIIEFVAVTVIVGGGFTVIVFTAVFVHPLTLVAVKV